MFQRASSWAGQLKDAFADTVAGSQRAVVRGIASHTHVQQVIEPFIVPIILVVHWLPGSQPSLGRRLLWHVVGGLIELDTPRKTPLRLLVFLLAFGDASPPDA